jgi:hypothetical protein
LTGQIKSPRHRSLPTATVVAASVASFIVVVLIIISLVLLATRRPITSGKIATLFDLLSQLEAFIKKKRGGGQDNDYYASKSYAQTKLL